MAINMRCTKCNEMLTIPAGVTGAFRCQKCGKRLHVPRALAAFPTPQFNAVAQPRPAAPAEQTHDHDAPHTIPVADQDSPAMVRLARAMPFVISAVFHVSIFLLMLLVTSVIMLPKINPAIANMPLAPDYDLTKPANNVVVTGKVFNTDVQHDPTQPVKTPMQDQILSPQKGLAKDLGDPNKTGRNSGNLNTIVIGNGGGGDGGGAIAPFGPPNNIFNPPPQGSRPAEVVFVIDRSGSMIDTFDTVRVEMLKSISRMGEGHKFHVIMFNDAKPLENAPRALVKAERASKTEVAEFLAGVRAGGKTDPLPAISRAFEVLNGGSKDNVKVIHLLTDGVFPDNQAVTDVIRKLNTGKSVIINTYLYGNCPTPAVDVMTKIAADNNGKCNLVRHED